MCYTHTAIKCKEQQIQDFEIFAFIYFISHFSKMYLKQKQPAVEKLQYTRFLLALPVKTTSSILMLKTLRKRKVKDTRFPNLHSNIKQSDHTVAKSHKFVTNRNSCQSCETDRKDETEIPINQVLLMQKTREKKHFLSFWTVN